MTLSDELRGMLEKARRYVNSAEILQREKDYDSAVSRLYYAMFYCAEALLLSKGLTFSSHRAVISAFAQHFIKTNILPKEFHQWLHEAFEKRQISDYDFGAPASDPDAEGLRTKAKMFIARTEELLRQEKVL